MRLFGYIDSRDSPQATRNVARYLSAVSSLKTDERLIRKDFRAVNQSAGELDRKSPRLREIKLAAVIKVAATLISMSIGTNGTEGDRVLYLPFSLPLCLSSPGVRQSCKYGRLESSENGYPTVASHVLHKIMTCAPSDARVSRTRRQFHSIRAGVRRRDEEKKGGGRGEREKESYPPDRTLWRFSRRKINGNNGDTHGSVRF